MTRKSSEILLAALIVSRASSLLLAKPMVGSLSSSSILAYRFILASIFLLPFLFKKVKTAKAKDVGRGCVLGMLFSVMMQLELLTLKSLDTATTSLLENTAIIIVPLTSAFIAKRRPSPFTLKRAAIALLGVFFLTVSAASGKGSVKGCMMALVSAMIYSSCIELTDTYSKESDTMVLGYFQIVTLGVLNLLFGLASGTLEAIPDKASVMRILALAIVCSGFGFALQPVAQRNLDAATSSSFCALNPLSTTILGAIFLSESMGAEKLIGVILIMSSLLLKEKGKGRKVLGKAALRA